MENTANALLIAAGVLIGILIISLGVYLANILGGYAADTQNQIDRNTVAQFNNEFLKYDGLKDLTVQDIVTVKNYALENNREDSNYNPANNRANLNNDYVDVYVKMLNKQLEIVFLKNEQSFLENALGKKFECRVEINTNTERVHKIYFYEI